MFEMISYMGTQGIKKLFNNETKSGESVFKSGEYFVFLSGKTRETHGVGVIIHFSLLKSILSVKAI